MTELESGGASLDVATNTGTVIGSPFLVGISEAFRLILRVDTHALALVPVILMLAGITVLLLDPALAGAGLMVLHLDRLRDRVLGILGRDRQPLQDTGDLLDRDPRRQALQQVGGAAAAAASRNTNASGKDGDVWINGRVRVL